MSSPSHVFVTYIRTSPDKLWEAITSPDFTVRYFHGTRIESTYDPGAPVVYRNADGSVAVDGEVLEAEVGRKLAISWHVNYDENRGVGEGWPWILHSLKSLLETGTPLPPPEA